MQVKCFRIQNFRRLKNVQVDLELQTTIFVGANNSGKTSATHVFQLFLGSDKGAFTIYDFTADCWDVFTAFDLEAGDPDKDLPTITFDLWFTVDDLNIHRVIDLLPSLDWAGQLVGVRFVYAPRDGKQLIDNYKEARSKAQQPADQDAASYKPWPQNLMEYLTKRLRSEYEIKYFILDAQQCNEELVPRDDYEPFPLGTKESGAAKIIESLIRVDFLNAQRNLSDEPQARGESLSKRLSRFYQQRLDKRDVDLEALDAIAASEARFNEHFATVFKATLERLSVLGYPGIANPPLVVKAVLDPHTILSGSARVHYTLPADVAKPVSNDAPTLPDQYNGLGFKNLIYMVVEVLDYHHAWTATEADRPPVHLVMIEEPEAHLHAQLQQVFIRKILDVLPDREDGFQTQLVVTTHSSHIIYESDFRPIRYFCRAHEPTAVRCSEVKNLSTFYDKEEVATREFLQQYLKLTHCDLFFADAAILVEGNVERLLVPLLIKKSAAELQACHLTILEVGGAFAHKFEKLIDFLELTTLLITDLDSVAPRAAGADEDDDATDGRACMTSAPGAVTSNETLKQWIPRLGSIEELLAITDEHLVYQRADGSGGNVRVTYQRQQVATWRGETGHVAARTFEEAFALQNLSWCQDVQQKDLGSAH